MGLAAQEEQPKQELMVMMLQDAEPVVLLLEHLEMAIIAIVEAVQEDLVREEPPQERLAVVLTLVEAAIRVVQEDNLGQAVEATVMEVLENLLSPIPPQVVLRTFLPGNFPIFNRL